MRKGMLGSIAALAAGAGSAWAQAPMPVTPAGSPAGIKTVAAQEPFGVPGANGLEGPGGPSPVIMPPIGIGPPGDPHGIGPAGGNGPPPGPMYPMPGPYAQPLWQPAGPGGLGAEGPTGPGVGAPRFWFRNELLLWFPKAQPLSYPLLTTSAPNDLGLLNRASTLVLVGQGDLSFDLTTGGRFTVGFFGDANRRFGFEATGFFMTEKHNENFFQTTPSGIPTLARPYIDSLTRGTSSLLLANPNFASASVLIDASTRTYSAEASGVFNLFRSAPGSSLQFSLDFLAGYRFAELSEDLKIESQSTLIVPPTIQPVFVVGPNGTLTQVGQQVVPIPVPFGGTQIVSPSVVTVSDAIRTQNRFNGGQIGLRLEGRYGMFSLSATGKLALGHMHQTVELGGASNFVNLSYGASGAAFGGLYNNASNIGKYNNDEFAVMPEFTGNLALNVTRSVSTYVGYNFLYMNKVVRPGGQLNPLVNSAQIPFSPTFGQAGRPLVARQLFDQEDFWLMGVTMGLQIRF